MITNLDKRWIWFKGELRQADEARIYALAPSAQFGLNVFEGIPIYYNRETGISYAFRLADHFRRLIESARMLELMHDFSAEDMKNALVKTVIANGCDEDITVRQILFVDGVESWASEGPVEMIVSPLPRRVASKEYKKKALNCCISSWRRINETSMSPKIKCGANYINSRMGQREAIRNGYDTCIFLNEDGMIAEAPGSCFFMVSNGSLITPRITDSILSSITRDTVLRIAKEIGLPVEVRSIARSEVYTCEEAFLCGSTMEITSIESIDRYVIAKRRLTEKILELYLRIARGMEHKFNDYILAIN